MDYKTLAAHFANNLIPGIPTTLKTNESLINVAINLPVASALREREGNNYYNKNLDLGQNMLKPAFS